MVHQTMKTANPNATSASITSIHMARILWIALALTGCSTVLPPEVQPLPAAPPTPTTPAAPAAAPIEPPRPNWQAAEWADLPGWQADKLLEAWPALRASCSTPKAPWREWCAHVALTSPASDNELRSLLQAQLQPMRVTSAQGDATGLATGYFEPLIEARRERAPPFVVPLHASPADLATRKPWWTRQQIETDPAAQAALRGREIAYVADPLDALMLQIQGSGRVRITERDGRIHTVRLAFAGHNDQPYRSVGRWLIEQRQLAADGVSWPAIRDWARRQRPARVQQMLWANPRTVFFREEPLPDPTQGPRGAMGVPLTPGRSIAVDPQSIPYGAPVWLATTEPLSNTPLQRLVAAQDTGSAIIGAVRADYFWGWGPQAEASAGRMKQPLQLWVLWPRAYTGPTPSQEVRR